MIYQFLFITIFLSLSMLVWAFIQKMWKSTFSEEYDQEDALVHRSDCHGCGACGNSCQNKNSSTHTKS